MFCHGSPVAFLSPPAVPVVLRVTEDEDGVKTMSSLDMVAFINSTRTAGESEVRHDHFMAKAPTVIDNAPNFRGVYIGGNGQERPCYNFPRREAMLMAMSYSYKLQATVYDAWQEAEAKVAAQAPVLFGAPTNYLDALKQLVASVAASGSARKAAMAPPRHERTHPATMLHPHAFKRLRAYTSLWVKRWPYREFNSSTTETILLVNTTELQTTPTPYLR